MKIKLDHEELFLLFVDDIYFPYVIFFNFLFSFELSQLTSFSRLKLVTVLLYTHFLYFTAPNYFEGFVLPSKHWTLHLQGDPSSGAVIKKIKTFIYINSRLVTVVTAAYELTTSKWKSDSLVKLRMDSGQ